MLELELAVVHDADDGRSSERCDFHQIQPLFLCLRERGVHLENAELTAVGRDHAQRADADLAVDADALGGVLNGRYLRRGKKNRGHHSGVRDARRAPAFGRRIELRTPAAHLAREREGRRVRAKVSLYLLDCQYTIYRGMDGKSTPVCWRRSYRTAKGAGHESDQGMTNRVSTILARYFRCQPKEYRSSRAQSIAAQRVRSVFSSVQSVQSVFPKLSEPARAAVALPLRGEQCTASTALDEYDTNGLNGSNGQRQTPAGATVCHPACIGLIDLVSLV